MRAWLSRGRMWLLYTTVGGVAVLEGCDSSVRTDVLTGVGQAATGLATTFIQAFFDGLINKESSSDTSGGSVVQTVDNASLKIFC